MRKVTEKQYTIRMVPPRIDQALRHYARLHGQSINQATIDVLTAGLGIGDKKLQHHDLDFMAGSWKDDPAFDAAIAAQDQIDSELWR